MVNDTEFRRILHSHPAYVLREYIRQHNISGYSKMKKAEIIDIMMYYKSRFKHIKRYAKPKKPRAPRARKFKNKEELSEALREIMNKRPKPTGTTGAPASALSNLGLGLARRR